MSARRSPARPPTSRSASLRLSAHRPRPPAAETPANKPKWRRRGWLHREKVSLAAIPAESDVVLTARIGRTVTIATALITALVGITGTIGSGAWTYLQGSEQLGHDNEKSATEFLRKERLTVYAEFSQHAWRTANSMNELNALFDPGGQHPSAQDAHDAATKYDDELKTLKDNSPRLDLLAPDRVIFAAADLLHVFNGYQTGHEAAAWAYSNSHTVADDNNFAGVHMTADEFSDIRNAVTHFDTLASGDLCDPDPRAPLSVCSATVLKGS